MPEKSPSERVRCSWNPVTGCTPESAGCEHCYARAFALRLRGMGMRKYARGFCVTLHEEALEQPLHWKKGRLIFANSMSDLLHPDVPTAFIARVLDVMRRTPQHLYQTLTKRSHRLVELDAQLEWPRNLCLGVTVERADYLFRVDDLRRTHAACKWLCLEPLLGPLHDLNLTGIDWVILGGESGVGARPLAEEWVLEVRDRCVAQGVAFYFKQWGGVARQRTGRLLQGREWVQHPPLVEEWLSRREKPDF